jgi:hypothetical protein
MRGTRALLIVLSLLTGAGILAQWILVWAGVFPVEDTVPGFRNYFMAFVAADMWRVLAAFATGVCAAMKDDRAVLFGVALGSAMIFFGLYALMYDLNTGLLFDLSAGELFGKIVTLYNLLGGLLFVFLSWGSRRSSFLTR